MHYLKNIGNVGEVDPEVLTHSYGSFTFMLVMMKMVSSLGDLQAACHGKKEGCLLRSSS